MNANFESKTPINESVLSAQSEDITKAIEVLEESKDDLKDDWMKENFDQTIRALKEKRSMK